MEGSAAAPATAAAFQSIDWDAILGDCKHCTCSSYWPRLMAAADAAQEGGDLARADALRLLGHACSLALQNDDPEILVSTIRFETGRSASLQDFSDEGLTLFGGALPSIVDPAIRSRLADILYLRRADWRMGRRAVDAYLVLAEGLVANGQISRIDVYCHRALDLAAKLGRRGKLFADTVARVEGLVRQIVAGPAPRPALALLQVLLAHKQVLSPEIVGTIESWMREGVEKKEWFWALSCCGTLAKLKGVAGDRAGVEASTVEHSRVFELQAAEAAAQDPPNFLVAADCMQRAIALLRKVQGTKGKRLALAAKLRDWEQRGVKQLGTISTRFDVSPLVRTARREVSGKRFRDALLALAIMHRPTPLSELERDTKEAIQQSPMQHLLSTVMLDPEGRVVARRPPMPLGDAAAAKAAFEAQMFETSKFYQAYSTQGIDAARMQIAFEHAVAFDRVFEIVATSPLVPPDRPVAFSQGILLGLLGDYAGAAHVLIPQLENALRYLLSRIGVLTTRQQHDLTQEEPDLNVLLRAPELTQLLDEDTVFDLRGLLVERFGSNLRNRLMHGLVSDGQLQSSQVAYLWWSVLRLCCLPLLQQLENADGQTEEERHA